jgi:uncharacterized protein (DUF2141 family)
MKKLLTTFLIGYAYVVQAQSLSLIINVKKFKNNDGLAYIMLQDPTKKLLQQQWTKIERKETQAVFKNLKAGKYVVQIYHDENNNKKLDTGFLGMPKEGWGCSNDIQPHFAAPKFEDMIFTVAKDETITITIN